MDTKTQAIINLLAEQRNQALNAFASAAGEIAERDEKIRELEAKVIALTPVVIVSMNT